MNNLEEPESGEKLEFDVAVALVSFLSVASQQQSSPSSDLALHFNHQPEDDREKHEQNSKQDWR